MPVFRNQRFHLNQDVKGYMIRILPFLWCCLLTWNVQSQCTLSAAVAIPDNGSTTIQFTVSGLVDNNLASPTQGICGVEIDFMHEYLGDLTISLMSPLGTVVDLIGPTTTAISPTNLSRWNIEFVPCAVLAMPDGGFSDQWSNLQAWQALTSYSGVYHPQNGCLENFSIGSANGIWQIIIQDHDLFQTGSIANITLIFCNPTGLACSECIANAGILTPASFSICSGESIQSSAISVDFGGNIPSAAVYNYEYLLVSGNAILQNGASFSSTPPIGNYSICGISYLIADTTLVNSLLSNGDYNALSQAISNGVVCADLTTSCISLDVMAKPDTVVVTSNLCNGEVFSFGGQNYFSDGFFYQVHDGPSLCDTVFEIRISTRELTVMVDDPDTLSCGNGSVGLNAIAGGAPGPFTYQWTTQVGNINSSSSGMSITVDQAGQYFVAVTDGVCDGAGSVIVHADQGFPQVFVEGGTITCNQPVISLNPIYIPTDGVLQWTGPLGFMSSQPNIAVTVPGVYILNISNQAGCTTSRSLVIGIDTITDDISIISLDKNCQTGLLTIGIDFSNNIVDRLWTGPNNFMTNASTPSISDVGLYTLLATFSNGCTRTVTFFFDGDFVIPDIVLSADDTLNCNEVITITVTSMTAGVLYAWNGPNGLSSAQPTIQVTQEGNYIGTVTALNGCQMQDLVTIVQGDDIFDFQILSDTLTCATDSVVIGVFATDADLFEWLNYSGIDANQPMIKVGVAGLYTVMMTDTNSGCVITTEVLVFGDFANPSFGYTTDTITCVDPIAELNFSPNVGFTYAQVYWELPDLSVVQGPILMSGLSGEHRLVGISPGGCISSTSIHIPFDTIPPFLILETDTLLCEDTLQIISQTLDSITSYQWNGPGIVVNMNAEISVSKPGWYQLSAFGRNGCFSNYDILVDSNFVAPSFSLVTDSLRCDRSAILQATSVDSIVSYSWYNAGSQLLSKDSVLMVNLPGQYSIEVQGVNRCIAYDTVMVDPLLFPVISLSSDTFSCIRLTAGLTANIDIPQFTIAWEDMNGDTIGMSSFINVMQAGPFAASVSGQNACETRDTISVPYDTLSPAASIELIGEVRCKERDVMFDGTKSTPLPLLYSWSNAGGTILSNPSDPTIQARDTGMYILVVQRPDNGCTDTARFHLQESPDAITEVFLDTSTPECSGDANASLEITGLQGGVKPFLYQLNGGTPQSDAIFDGLPSGTFFLTILDAENCVFDTTVLIIPVFSFTVDAGPDLEIYLGESIALSGMTDLLSSDILSDQWDSLGVGLCVDCAIFDVSPLETTTYGFQVTSNTGCVMKDLVIVYVVEKAKYYMANIFSPNGDGINDEVRIHPSPGIEKVLQWILFDRWGNAVYGKTNFDPDDPSVFWNGLTSTGEYANPGVFTYLLEVQLINGKNEVFHGDITLVR